MIKRIRRKHKKIKRKNNYKRWLKKTRRNNTSSVCMIYCLDCKKHTNNVASKMCNNDK